jgi:SAM-dependent methyltransferase
LISSPTLQIDPDGYFMSKGNRITDQEIGRSLLEKLVEQDGLYYTDFSDNRVLVEPFDRPLIPIQIEKTKDFTWSLVGPYSFRSKFDVRRIRLDAWDRFHGIDSRGIPFVMSRTAQAEFFRLVDDFSDDSVSISGNTITVPDFYEENQNAKDPSFWDEHYKSAQMPWDLGAHNPNLDGILAQLKLNKSKILVLGAGSGHDAEFFAERGHIVTAVDYSPEALTQFRKYYPNSAVKYVVADIFHLPKAWMNNFDVVFDHTLFCAVPPRLRKKTVETWKHVLAPHGHLLSLFFLLTGVGGPPYGVTEWEVQQHLQKDFDFIYWSRAKNSVAKRKDKELIVYAQKK